jgi:cytochrome b6-f complex iron-sulfur subunit
MDSEVSVAGPPTLPRRHFVDLALRLGVASTGLAIAYPVIRYLVPPPAGEPATTSVVAARLDAIRPNSGVIFKFGTKPGLLVRTPEGELRAFSAVCTHLECTVQYVADTSEIWCACHNGRYDLAGNVVSGPPPRSLERYAVHVRGEPGTEEVVVSRG